MRMTLRRGRAGCRFTGLAPNRLGRVLDSLALVRVRRPEFTNLRRHRSEQLPIGALERDGHLLLDLCGHTGRQLVYDRMRIPEGQIDLLRLGLGAVSDAVYLEHAGEALAHSLDHV